MQWLIEDRLENAHIGYRAIVDADGCTVCNPSPMGEANARLIAAAPDLLEALRDLLSRAEIELDQTATHDGLANCDALTRCRAAIAKATGDQTA
jgi:hypothetical protein